MGVTIIRRGYGRHEQLNRIVRSHFNPTPADSRTHAAHLIYHVQDHIEVLLGAQRLGNGLGTKTDAGYGPFFYAKLIQMFHGFGTRRAAVFGVDPMAIPVHVIVRQ